MLAAGIFFTGCARLQPAAAAAAANTTDVGPFGRFDGRP